jgi:hypothetical protein
VIASNPEPGTAGLWAASIGLMIVMRKRLVLLNFR